MSVGEIGEGFMHLNTETDKEIWKIAMQPSLPAFKDYE